MGSGSGVVSSILMTGEAGAARARGMVWFFARLGAGEFIGRPWLLGFSLRCRFEARVPGVGGAREERRRLGVEGVLAPEKGVCSRDPIALAIWDRGLRVGRELLVGLSIEGRMVSSSSILKRVRRSARVCTRLPMVSIATVVEIIVFEEIFGFGN